MEGSSVAPAPTSSPVSHRRAIIRAARQLAAEGGYDAVHVRDIVSRAGLSNGTVYHYFSSRDHILAAAQLEWVVELSQREDELAYSRDPVERATGVVRHICDALRAQPDLARALLFALNSRDPKVRQTRVAADALVMATFAEALGRGRREDGEVLDSLGLCLHGALFAWAHDQIDLDDVERMLTVCLRLLTSGASPVVVAATTEPDRVRDR